MYAIIDIETTGGKYNEEGITEIAIYKFDGHEVVDQFISLVNPEREIQPFVVNLTGINSNMLKNAPKFYEIAKRVVEITEGCVVVAHNAQFDNRILTTEFKRLGFDFDRETLCTVELAKTLIPDLPSYSLGKLVRSLGIPVTDRHRASGDALATVKLFKLLLSKDVEKTIIQTFLRKHPKLQLEPKLTDIIAQMPSETGVYYIHNKNGNIIYIGKSKNIKKRINQHFTGTDRKSKKIQIQVATVTYDTTGSELIALLKESHEIKQNKPLFNRAMRKTKISHALYSSIDSNGYINLTIDPADGRKKVITTFSNKQSAKDFLHRAVETYSLCLKLCGLEKTLDSCFRYELKECEGACLNEENTVLYNKRVNEFIEKYSYKDQNMIIIDKGRKVDERSAVLIENGVFTGYAFYDLNHQINNIDILKSIIIPMTNNRHTQHIIQSYLRKNKRLKILKF
ncbi:exonuclease domain-containing protein [Lacinutrix sp. Bg11-31]|uniref:exonuclease domain-containing protein n=1 Tax=Lacinutrix sp. Bg11-31 TaxID=2057808 RepID=UPI000C307DC8|nr:exonuclease domain-containing protein [Lacinutrix sp. Bg11-31]AUC81900.1 exonuclease [Lacinutrix sp. Bg11-31]